MRRLPAPVPWCVILLFGVVGCGPPQPAAPDCNSPALSDWLGCHPQISRAIKWQVNAPAWDPDNQVEPPSPPPPTESDKLPWAKWSQRRQDDLSAAYAQVTTW